MIVPKKLGVRFNPPALVYIYEDAGSLRMRVMPLRNLWPTSKTDFVLEDLRNRHSSYLQPVPDEKIKKMIEIIKGFKSGQNLQDAVDSASKSSVQKDSTSMTLTRQYGNEGRKTTVEITEVTDDYEEKVKPKLRDTGNIFFNLRQKSNLKKDDDEFKDFDFESDESNKSSDLEDILISKIKQKSKMTKNKGLDRGDGGTSWGSSMFPTLGPAKNSPPSFGSRVNLDRRRTSTEEDTLQEENKLTSFSKIRNNEPLKQNSFLRRNKTENQPRDSDTNGEDTDLDFKDSDNPLSDKEDIW